MGVYCYLLSLCLFRVREAQEADDPYGGSTEEEDNNETGSNFRFISSKQIFSLIFVSVLLIVTRCYIIFLSPFRMPAFLLLFLPQFYLSIDRIVELVQRDICSPNYSEIFHSGLLTS